MSIKNLFIGSLIITMVLYLLRGLGLVTFFPGGILLVLISITFVSGIFWGLNLTKRY